MATVTEMGKHSSCSEVFPDGRVLSFRIEGTEKAHSAETNTLELQRVFSGCSAPAARNLMTCDPIPALAGHVWQGSLRLSRDNV